MSVFKVGRRNGRWTYDFWLAGQRYQGYCVDPATNVEAKNRREATEIESTLRRPARQTHTLTRTRARPGTYTLAMAAALHLQRNVGTDPDHIANHKLYAAEILDFLGRRRQSPRSQPRTSRNFANTPQHRSCASGSAAPIRRSDTTAMTTDGGRQRRALARHAPPTI